MSCGARAVSAGPCSSMRVRAAARAQLSRARVSSGPPAPGGADGTKPSQRRPGQRGGAEDHAQGTLVVRVPAAAQPAACPQGEEELEGVDDEAARQQGAQPGSGAAVAAADGAPAHGVASPPRGPGEGARPRRLHRAAGAAAAPSRAWWAVGLVLLAAVLAVLWAYRDALRSPVSAEELLARFRGLGPWGPALVVALLVLETLVAPLPGMPLVAASALVYGPVSGFLLSWFGAWLGSMVAFALARRWLHRRVWTRLDAGRRELVERLGERHGFALLVLARLFPLTSVDWLAYAAGVSTIPSRTYALATALGLVPGVAVYTLAGTSVRWARDLETGLAAAGGVLLAAYVLGIWWRQRSARPRGEG